MTFKNICIFGGSGFVGKHLANLLTDREIYLRIPTRNYERAKELLEIPTTDLIEADIYDDRDLDRLLLGIDAVINLVGVLQGDFHAAHVELPQKLVAACKRNGGTRNTKSSNQAGYFVAETKFQNHHDPENHNDYFEEIFEEYYQLVI